MPGRSPKPTPRGQARQSRPAPARQAGPTAGGPMVGGPRTSGTAASRPTVSGPAAAPAPESNGPASAPLARILVSAALALEAVLEHGRSLTQVLDEIPPAMRAATQDLTFHALRQWGHVRTLQSLLLDRPPPEPGIHFLLGVALALLHGSAQAPWAPHYTEFTIVDQAVRAAQRQPRWQRYKNLINACLRRYQRERDHLDARARHDPEACWNHPLWWIEQLQRDHPDQWRRILESAQAPAPMTLRVNPRRTTRDRVVLALADAGVDAEPVLQHGLVLTQPRPVHQLPGFAEGWWSVQDAGAQLAASLLPLRDGMRVLDACAAPGGKTAHLLELANLELTALDNDAARLARVAANLDRLGLQAGLSRADASTLDWWDGRPFDAVLADVPCTASGIVRRHPDIRWLRRADDISRIAALQQQIADTLWQVVAPGGTLLYVTCSVFHAEGAQQAKAFELRHADALRQAAPGQLLPALSGAAPADQHDGFFYACFTKA